MPIAAGDASSPAPHRHESAKSWLHHQVQFDFWSANQNQ